MSRRLHDEDKQTVDYTGNHYIIHPSRTSSVSSLTQPPQAEPIKVIHPESLRNFESLAITDLDLWNKPFLGGYVDRKSKLKYHNAHSQHPFTPKLKRKQNNPSNRRLLCRQTQTVKTENAKQQTNHSQHTQMERSDLLLDTSKDVEIICNDHKPYINAKQNKLQKIECSVKIQCALRSFLAKKKLQTLKTQQIEQNEEQIFILQQKQISKNKKGDFS